MLAPETKPCKNRTLQTETPAAFAPLRGTGSRVVLELVTAEWGRNEAVDLLHDRGFGLETQAELNVPFEFFVPALPTGPVRSNPEYGL